MRELQRRLPGPVHVALSGHRLYVSVPLEVERLAPEPHGAAHSVLGLLVTRELAHDLDLTIPVPGVLLRVELIRGRCALAESVVADELFEDATRSSVGSAVHRLDEREKRDAFERAAVLTTGADHLNGRERPRRGIGTIRLLARDAGSLEKLQHDVDVRARA